MNELILSKKNVLIWILFFALLLIFFFWQAEDKETNKISLDQAGQALVNHINGELKQENAMSFKKRYSLSPEDYKQIIYFGPVSNMNVEEVLLVEMKDPLQENDLKKAMEDRIRYQINNFDGYGIDQMELLKSAKIIFYGNYGVLIIAENAHEVETILQNQIKGGET